MELTSRMAGALSEAKYTGELVGAKASGADVHIEETIREASKK